MNEFEPNSLSQSFTHLYEVNQYSQNHRDGLIAEIKAGAALKAQC